MHRFFIDKDQIKGDKILIRGNDTRHIRDALRLNIGDKIEVSSEGYNYLSTIENILKDKIELRIISKEEGRSESKIEIILYQALSKGSKMDLIIQKNTEIGVKKFIGLITHRTIVKINDIKKEKKKIDRWNMIAAEAAKQSKRDFIPKVENIQTFDEMLNAIKNEENIIVPYEDEKFQSIGDSLKSIESGRIILIIGPEGGFESEEIQKLRSIGGQIVSLGNRILRTETAGFVASAIILYELGGLGVI